MADPKLTPRRPAATSDSANTNSSFSTSPLKATVQGTLDFSHQIKDAKTLQGLFADEMRGLWVGPLDTQTFFSSFMKTAGLPPRELLSTVNFDRIPLPASREPDMYEPFVSGYICGILLVPTAFTPRFLLAL